jgi:hypothetical protein
VPDVVDDDVYSSVANTGDAAWSASSRAATAQNPTVGKRSPACCLAFRVSIVAVGRRAAEISLSASAIVLTIISM